MKKVLAIDMGATSIRGVLGYIEDNKLITKTIHRFNHEIVDSNGRKRWEWEKIIKEIEKIILKYGKDIVSIGIDTWGVDFGLLDKDGNLIEDPISYRDLKNNLGFDYSENVISNKNLFLETGNQIININSLYQLITYKLLNEKEFKKIDKILLLPDLINYYLTSKKYAELTIASTTQMLNLNEKKWNYNITDLFEFPKTIFPEIIENKSIVGNTKDSKIESISNTNIDVISVASHDTASAVFLTKAYREKKYAFISSGTWSLVGCCTDKPYINKDTFSKDLTNEIGFDSKNMVLKNVTGLYLVERLRRELQEYYNKDFDYDFIIKLVVNTDAFKVYIDTDYEDFTNEEIPIIKSIEEYLVKTNQDILDDKTEYFRGLYEGLVFKYYEVISNIEELIGYKFKGIHIIGGGSKADYFNQMIADALDKIVIAGPDEATAMGNILAQLSVVEEGNINIDKLVNNSCKLKEFTPRENMEWIKKYKMMKVIERN